ncbi:UNVERIFIED_CONTAM: hypothetical protein GTU68_023658 [Idotea baltica]|nr:hypothetical protein [Idotea baltica]
MRYFEAVATHGHFGRAADACFVSQPAISLQIKELEEALGNVLFERQARHVRLTPFGEEFADRVRPILQSIDDLGELARASQDGAIGRLRMGTIPTIAPYLLPCIIAGLTEAFPSLDLRIRETQTEKLISDLIDGRLDAALLALPISRPELTETPLFDEDFVFVRHVSDAKDPVPNGTSLSKMKLLLLEEGHCFRDQALSFCEMNSAASQELMEGSSLSTLVQMVASGMGVTLIPEMAVGLETKSANVSVARFPAPQPRRTIGMVWRKTTPLARQLSDIAEIIETSAQQVD